MFDFSTAESLPEATGVTYLQPGKYTAVLTDVEKKDTKPDKSPAMTCTFTAISEDPELNGAIATADFFITPKSLRRLQTLHMGCFGAEAQTQLSTAEEVIAYFKACVPKAKPAKMVIGGRIWNNKVYNDLPFSNFFVSEAEADSFTEGAFEVNSSIFQKYMTSDIKTINLKGDSDSDFGSTEDEDFGAF